MLCELYPEIKNFFLLDEHLLPEFTRASSEQILEQPAANHTALSKFAKTLKNVI